MPKTAQKSSFQIPPSFEDNEADGEVEVLHHYHYHFHGWDTKGKKFGAEPDMNSEYILPYGPPPQFPEE